MELCVSGKLLCFLLRAEDWRWEEVHPSCSQFLRNACLFQAEQHTPKMRTIMEKDTMFFWVLCCISLSALKSPVGDSSQDVWLSEHSRSMLILSALAFEAPTELHSRLRVVYHLCQDQLWSSMTVTLRRATTPLWYMLTNHDKGVEIFGAHLDVRRVCDACLQMWTKESACVVVRSWRPELEQSFNAGVFFSFNDYMLLHMLSCVSAW